MLVPPPLPGPSLLVDFPVPQAAVENNLARKEQELLEMLMQQRSQLTVTTESTLLEQRMSAAEAEAAVRN